MSLLLPSPPNDGISIGLKLPTLNQSEVDSDNVGYDNISNYEIE